jgi:hypothetical protein
MRFDGSRFEEDREASSILGEDAEAEAAGAP